MREIEVLKDSLLSIFSKDESIKPKDVIKILKDYPKRDNKLVPEDIPVTIVYEDDHCLVFKDINPVAKIHVLGITKIKCIDLNDFVL